MSPHRERVVHGTNVSEHLVQLFDESNSLAAALSEFLYDGWKRGDHLLVVARPANWALTTPHLEALGCPVADTIASGRLVVLDAATTMATFMDHDHPDADKFRAHVGALVQRLCALSREGLTVYGEMVDILAGQGNFHGAEELETLWNSLSETCSFRLLCGYTADHFGNEANASHLHTICGLHTHASAPPADMLSTWLLANRRPRFHLEQPQ
jgi:hypothetical protein